MAGKITFQVRSEMFLRVLQRQAAEACEKVAEMIRTELKLEFDKPKSGHWYDLPESQGQPGEQYQASAPGEYPARPTSELFAGIEISDPDISATSVRVYIGTDVEHGILLEGGKQNVPGTGIRPWLSKIFNEPRVQNNAQQIFMQYMGRPM